MATRYGYEQQNSAKDTYRWTFSSAQHAFGVWNSATPSGTRLLWGSKESCPKRLDTVRSDAWTSTQSLDGQNPQRSESMWKWKDQRSGRIELPMQMIKMRKYWWAFLRDLETLRRPIGRGAMAEMAGIGSFIRSSSASLFHKRREQSPTQHLLWQMSREPPAIGARHVSRCDSGIVAHARHVRSAGDGNGEFCSEQS